ncbi:MAG: hypothetical protein RI905_568 [Pseudomonadota bacterium]|jgi:chitodextrinase
MIFYKRLFVLMFCVYANAYSQVVWNSNNFYQKGAVVKDDGIAYIAISRNMNKQPKYSPQFWVQRSMYNSDMKPMTVENQTPITIGISSDLNFGMDKAGGSMSPQLETWSSAKEYTKGKIVSFDGATWRANYWNLNELPGSSEAWSPTVTTKWSPNIAYVKGQSASYNGIIYKAQWWTKGDIPLNDKTGVWLVESASIPNFSSGKNYQNQGVESNFQPLSNEQPQTQIAQFIGSDQVINPNLYPAWRSDLKYSSGALVSFGNAVWRKNGDIDSRKGPSEDAQWIPVTRTKWYANVVYQKGMTVNHNEKIWYAQWYNVNIFPPADTTGVWVEIDTKGNRVYTSDKSEYLVSRVYVKGDKCMYNGHAWLSMYWNQGEVPGSTMAWVPLAITKWYPSVAYDPRDLSDYRYHVIYNGIQWKALYWTQGDIPSKSAAWRPLLVTDWISAFAYYKDDEVMYDGVKWRAKWWTQGELPLNSDVWEPLTTSNWSPLRSYQAGNKVFHDGSTWVALWWVKGELPGASSAWKKN